MGNLIIQKILMIFILFLAIFSQSSYSKKPENWYDQPQKGNEPGGLGVSAVLPTSGTQIFLKNLL